MGMQVPLTFRGSHEEWEYKYLFDVCATVAPDSEHGNDIRRVNSCILEDFEDLEIDVGVVTAKKLFFRHYCRLGPPRLEATMSRHIPDKRE